MEKVSQRYLRHIHIRNVSLQEDQQKQQNIFMGL